MLYGVDCFAFGFCLLLVVFVALLVELQFSGFVCLVIVACAFAFFVAIPVRC